jgi:hypothetical protein
VLQNRVLRKIFELKREGVTASRKQLYSEELHDLCSSPACLGNQTKEDEIAVHFCTCGGQDKCMQGCGGNT